MTTEKKVAVITGGYKGIGGALSELLAKKGYALVIGGRNEKELRAFSKTLQKWTEAEPVVMDVRKKEDCVSFFQQAVQRFGKVDLFVNNAGMLGKKQSMEEISEEELRETFETNVYGPFFCMQEAVKIMKKQGFGHILNIGSTSAIDSSSSNLAYASSKAALTGCTATLRNELSGTGIRVSIFHPAGTKTAIFQRFQSERNIERFMDAELVAQKIVEHLSSDTSEWSVVFRGEEKQKEKEEK